MNAALSAAVLDEAAEWLLRVHSGEASEADRRALDRWREQHPDHERAWQRAQLFLQGMHGLPSGIGHRLLDPPASASRRRAIRQMALLLAAVPTGWLVLEQTPWRRWSADYRSATGETRAVTLADGTQLVLNTASAVDVRFDAQRRTLHLRGGEILVTTGHDSATRPFFVETSEGSVQAVGTRFTVRQHAARSEVAVYEGAVDLRPGDAAQAVMRLAAGQRSSFTQRAADAAMPARAVATMWTRGMLVAENMRLDDLLAELDRYRAGRLRCDPAVAALHISGAFPLTDIPRSLELIQDVLPVQIASSLHYWTVIEPRS